MRTPEALAGLDGAGDPRRRVDDDRRRRSSATGSSRAIRAHVERRPADPRHLRRDDRLRPRAPRAARRRLPPQRLRPPDRELRGRPRDRRDRPRAAARGVHPRAWVETRRRRASRCSPRSTATRSRSARAASLACSFHPELTDDSRLHALLMAMATAACEDRDRSTSPSATAKEIDERPAGRQPGEDPGRLLDQGRRGRHVPDRGPDGRRAAGRGGLRGGAEGRRAARSSRCSFEASRRPSSSTPPTRSSSGSRRSRVGGRGVPTAGSRSAPTPTPASSRSVAPERQTTAPARRPAS